MSAAVVVRRRDTVVFTVVVTLACLLGGLAVVGALAVMAAGAPGGFAAAVLLSLLPVGPLMGVFLWLDRYEPEPRRLLVAGFAWGALVATTATILVMLLFSTSSDFVQTAVATPLVEEGFKGLFLALLLWWRRHELDGVLDGIVYAGFVGIGFAFVENIGYLTLAVVSAAELGMTAGESLGWTFFMRCLLSPFAHPFFTAFIGVGIGIAVQSRSSLVRVAAPLLGWGLASLLHGIWNGSTYYAEGIGFIVAYVALMAPGFLLAIGVALWLRSSEKQLLLASLHDAARRGLFPVQEIDWVVDLGARRRARLHAAALGGAAGRGAMEEYQQAAVELGFLHHRYLRGTAPEDFAVRGQSFVTRLDAVRPHISFPGQVLHTR